MLFSKPWAVMPFSGVAGAPAEAPIGSVVPYAGQLERALFQFQGWLCCDGSSVFKAEYPELYLAIGDTYGSADSSAMFVLPDYRGYFHRGLDDASQSPPVDPDISERTNSAGQSYSGVGSIQQDQFQEHEHCYDAPAEAGATPVTLEAEAGEGGTLLSESKATSSIVSFGQGGQPCADSSPAGGEDSNSDTPRYGVETRPKNIYVYYLIKARHDSCLLQVPAWPLGMWPCP